MRKSADEHAARKQQAQSCENLVAFSMALQLCWERHGTHRKLPSRVDTLDLKALSTGSSRTRNIEGVGG